MLGVDFAGAPDVFGRKWLRLLSLLSASAR